MRRRTLLVLVSVLALVVVAPEVAAAKAGGTDRPWKGSLSGTATLDASTVPSPVTAEGTGTVAHLGKVTYSIDFTLTPEADGTFTLAGTAEFVAANGDQVFTAFTGSSQPTGPGTTEATTNATITGGTGRFEGASGSITATMVTQVTSLVGTTSTADQTLRQRGTISY
jgi:hypothetical protein